MYIAGRLRTASIPPRTLIEVASYLCPADGPALPVPFGAGFSLSVMDRASPQKAASGPQTCAQDRKTSAMLESCSGRRSRGSARLTLPIGPIRSAWALGPGLEGFL